MALMDNQSSSLQDDSSKEIAQITKLTADKVSAGASKIINHHSNSTLHNNEKSANNQLHIADNSSSVLKVNNEQMELQLFADEDGQHRGDNSTLHNNEKSVNTQLHIADSSSSVLKVNNEQTTSQLHTAESGNKLKNHYSSAFKADEQHGSSRDTLDNNKKPADTQLHIADSSSSVLKVDNEQTTSQLHTAESGNKLKNHYSSALKVDGQYGNSNATLDNNKKPANSQLHTTDNSSSVLKVNKKQVDSQLLVDKSGNKLKSYYSSALRVDGQHRGNERLYARFMPDEQRIDKNSKKIDKIEHKLNKTMKGRYYRDFSIKGGILTSLRIESSMKSKLRPTSLEQATGRLESKAKGALSKTAGMLDSDELGIQKAWVDTTDKAIGAVSTVYRVSKTAKYWRNMKKEMKTAKLLRKEEKILRDTFRTEYRQAFNLFKASDVGKSSSFYEKQRYKRFLKRKYMKNAMKQYKEAKKVGNASRTAFSTGLSIKDTFVKAGESLVDVFKALLSKKTTWVVLLCVAGCVLLPVIFSAFINIFMSLFGGDIADEESQANQSMPEDVVQWREFVEERCAANNDSSSNTDLTKFVNAILATIWQESGGNPDTCSGDVMQCKACGLWDDSKMPSDWSEAQKSIDVGIRYFYTGLKSWGVTDPEDYDGLQIVAQGYNYGFAYLNWMKGKKATKWTRELSAEYSAEKAAAAGWSSYGHIPYGEEWLEKYKGSSGGAGSGEVVKEKGVDGVVNTALNQEGITEDPPGSNTVIFNTDFYGSEVSGDKYPWCCAFVWWCFDKSGNGDLIPKTAGCGDMQARIADYGGKRISNVYEAKRGDLVIFRSGQHIGIVVENKGGGNLVTIEGNTTPENGSGSDYNGGCVAKRNRNISASGITAVLRPKYPDSDSESTTEKEK